MRIRQATRDVLEVIDDGEGRQSQHFADKVGHCRTSYRQSVFEQRVGKPSERDTAPSEQSCLRAQAQIVAGDALCELGGSPQFVPRHEIALRWIPVGMAVALDGRAGRERYAGERVAHGDSSGQRKCGPWLLLTLRVRRIYRQFGTMFYYLLELPVTDILCWRTKGRASRGRLVGVAFVCPLRYVAGRGAAIAIRDLPRQRTHDAATALLLFPSVSEDSYRPGKDE